MKSRFSLVSSWKKETKQNFLVSYVVQRCEWLCFCFCSSFQRKQFPRHSAFKTSAVEGCYVRSIQYVYVCLWHLAERYERWCQFNQSFLTIKAEMNRSLPTWLVCKRKSIIDKLSCNDFAFRMFMLKKEVHDGEAPSAGRQGKSKGVNFQSGWISSGEASHPSWAMSPFTNCWYSEPAVTTDSLYFTLFLLSTFYHFWLVVSEDA